jgi:hypothetical protein
MITGAHAIIYSQQAGDVRAFLRGVLGFDSVDAGEGWLIFALPPAELAVHPTDGSSRHELYLQCDDISATVEDLEAKGVEFTQPISDQGWGLLTAIRLPGGAEIGIGGCRCSAGSTRSTGSPPGGWPTVRLADTPRVFGDLDEWLGRRMRRIRLKEWKRYSARHRNLRALGIPERTARDGLDPARATGESPDRPSSIGRRTRTRMSGGVGGAGRPGPLPDLR